MSQTNKYIYPLDQLVMAEQYILTTTSQCVACQNYDTSKTAMLPLCDIYLHVKIRGLNLFHFKPIQLENVLNYILNYSFSS